MLHEMNYSKQRYKKELIKIASRCNTPEQFEEERKKYFPLSSTKIVYHNGSWMGMAMSHYHGSISF